MCTLVSNLRAKKIGLLFKDENGAGERVAESGSNFLKVSQFRKDFLLFSFEPKNERNISALDVISSGQKYFARFLVQMKTTKSPFEIY